MTENKSVIAKNCAGTDRKEWEAIFWSDDCIYTCQNAQKYTCTMGASYCIQTISAKFNKMGNLIKKLRLGIKFWVCST